MKLFDYPAIEVRFSQQVPGDAQSCIEWRKESTHNVINQHLNGETSLKTLLETGQQWTYQTEPESRSTFELLSAARDLVRGAWRKDDQHIALSFDNTELGDALLSAILAAWYQLPSFKKDSAKTPSLTLSITGPLANEEVEKRLAEAEGNAFTRYLSELPANELNPWSYRELVEDLAEAEGWDCKVFRYKELEQMGAGAFLAVARGSEHNEASIVRVHYRGDADSVESIALVGKGITMDTGGYNLKISGSMFGMNGDMGGSALVLGNILTASRRKQKVNLTGWLAITDNHLGPKAFHANEWVRALNGTTIEIVDTDAEGRMVLADTLTLASREHPKAVFDYATLTGACVGALSTRYSGCFTNHDAWFLPLIEAGKASGERVWPFPLDADYDDNIKSDVADVMQCNPGKSSDHIDAARFLSRFVEPSVPWLHIDLSSARHKGGLAHVPTDVTGYGVRLTQNLLSLLF
ncbi:leucyl aminopeptidase family protein [Reinekea forsetii]|nr:leucyl aminopeptidase family protein [Reinekea forsetii]